MAEQHVKLMQGLGVPQDQIDKVEKLTPDELKDWKPDEITNLVKGTMKSGFLNDQEFLNSIPDDKIPEGTRKKLEAGQYARFQNEIIDTAKKQLGLEDTDLSDLTEEDKKSIKKTVAKVAEKYLTKKGNVAGLAEMQQQLKKAVDDLTQKDTAWQEKLNTELEKVNGSNSARMIKNLTKAGLATLEGVEYPVAVHFLVDPILNSLQSKYSIVLGPNDELQIMQKANPALEVLVDNKTLTFADALKAEVIAQKAGKLKEEKKDPPGPTRVTVNDDEGGVPSYIKDKIDANSKLDK